MVKKNLFIKLYGLLTIILDVALVFGLKLCNSFADIYIPIILLPLIFIGFFVFHVVSTILLSLLVSAKKQYDKPNKFYRYWVDETVQYVFNLLMVKVKVNGVELLPIDRRFLLVSNHISGFDPMVCVKALKKYNIVYIAKPEILKIPVVNAFLNVCCFMAIDRENARNAMKTIRRATDLVKNDIVSVGVYPEGTRSRTGELLEFKDGVFYTAKKAPCPVVVMTVKGTNKFWKCVFSCKNFIEINVLKVIEPEEFESKATHEISELAREIMLDNLK